ncbi:MAG TPA: hypothetical protein VJC15_00625 [Candidatus Paceibacterota bacterium]
MNPMLLRLAGVLLAAAIAGAGGGYLAANNKTDRPAPSSGTTVAIPAQPFPGQGIPATPATPAIPLVRGTEPNSAPVLTSVDPSFVPYKPKGNLVNAGQFAVINGSNFVSKHNTIFWDGKELINDRDAYLYESAEGIGFTAPADAKPGSIHAVAVKTQHGMSNTINVQVVEYFQMELGALPSFCGVSPYTGAVGAKVRVCATQPSSPYQYTTEKLYMDFIVPASLVKADETGGIRVAAPVALQKIEGEANVYSFVIPEEAVYCPSFIPFWGDRPDGGCPLAPRDTKVKLTAGSYPVYLWYIYQYPYSMWTSMSHQSWYMGSEPYGSWHRIFTITP